MIGAELTKLDEWTLSLFTNTELLACLGENSRGMQIRRTEEQAVWINKDAVSGRLCVALFNLSDKDKTLSVSLEELPETDAPDRVEGTEGMEMDGPAVKDGLTTKGSLLADRILHELWTKEESRTTSGRIEAFVPAHGVRVYRVEG